MGCAKNCYGVESHTCICYRKLFCFVQLMLFDACGLTVMLQPIWAIARDTTQHDIIEFAFTNGEPTRNAGMAVPLLSVVLATLMALFRNSRMASMVAQDDLARLIKATGKCLLDPRLAVSATHASGLDESTSSQMVRGMNKVCRDSPKLTHRFAWHF